MSRVNEKRVQPRYAEKSHLNWMGGHSYSIGDPIYNLRLAASSCFFGEPQYYHKDKKAPVKSSDFRPRLSGPQLEYLRTTLDAVDPQEWRSWAPSTMMEHAIDKALDHDVEATLQEAVRLRNEEYIRTTPQIILVRAANHPKAKGTGFIRKYAPSIIKRADEPATCIAYQKAAFGKPIPNSLKKALKDALESFNDYQLAKYRCETNVVKTVDVVNLVHPARTDAIDKLVKGTLKTDNRTWESIRSSGGSWEKALEVMGHMALLRNLRNLEQAGVDKGLFLDKLIEGVPYGKQLPFRYYSAYNAVKAAGGSPQTLDAIETCLERSFENAPHFAGRTMSLCDNSGSARGTTTSEMGTMRVSDIANLTGAVTGRASDEGYIGVFGDRLETLPVRKKDSIFSVTADADRLGQTIGGSTEHGIWLFWDQAIREKQHWDNVFVYSDMQAGHGGLYGVGGYSNYVWGGGRHIDVPKLINAYRSQVNPKVNVFLVQVAGYQDTIVPEFYNRTYILGGWGSGILRFAASMSQPLSQ